MFQMNNKSHIIQQMTSRELKNQVWLTQVIWFILNSLLLVFLVDVDHLIKSLHWNLYEIIVYGVIVGLFISIMNILLIHIFPKRMWDDGGINEKVFREGSRLEIILLCFIVAIMEEILFRGIIQAIFGYWIASIVFAVVHFRYLKKPLLLLSIVFLSFGIGYIFMYTSNLLVVILLHFVLNVTLALRIRHKGEWG